MSPTQITLDLVAYQLTDRQLADLRKVFHFLMRKAAEHTKGNITIPFDDHGNIGPVKNETYFSVAERTNGASSHGS